MVKFANSYSRSVAEIMEWSSRYKTLVPDGKSVFAVAARFWGWQPFAAPGILG